MRYLDQVEWGALTIDLTVQLLVLLLLLRVKFSATADLLFVKTFKCHLRATLHFDSCR